MPTNDKLERRKFLRLAGATGLGAGMAGCGGEGDTEPRTAPPDDDGGGDGGGEQGVDEGDGRLPPENPDDYEPVGEVDWIGISRETAPERFTAQQLASETLAELGLDINLRPMELPPLFDHWVERDFDLLTLWWVARPSRLDPHFMLYFNFHSKFAEEGENAEQYINPKYDEAADGVKTTYDEAERIEWAKRAQEIIARDQPGIFLFHAFTLAAANTNLFEGWKPQIGTQVFWNLDNLQSITPKTDDRTVIWATQREATAVNPMDVLGNAAAQATKMIYSRLTRWDADGVSRPWAAEEIESIDDTTIRAVLHDDLVFHDGEPVTAHDVAFSFDYYNQYSVPYLAAHYDTVERTDVIDDRTVEFHLEEPHAAFISVSLSQLNILPQHVWEGVVEDQGLSHPNEWPDPDFTGSGPFELVDYEPGDRVLYETFDDYPLADIDFDRLLWQLYGSETAAVGDLENDAVTFVQEIQPDAFERLEGLDHVETISNPTHGASNIWAQNQREPYNDVVFRQALAHAIDQEQIISIALRGRGDVSTQPIAPANEKFHNPDTPTYDGGIDHAVELLAEAGYRWDENGQLLKPTERFEGDGPPTTGDACSVELGHCYEVF